MESMKRVAGSDLTGPANALEAKSTAEAATLAENDGLATGGNGMDLMGGGSIVSVVFISGTASWRAGRGMAHD